MHKETGSQVTTSTTSRPARESSVLKVPKCRALSAPPLRFLDLDDGRIAVFRSIRYHQHRLARIRLPEQQQRLGLSFVGAWTAEIVNRDRPASRLPEEHLGLAGLTLLRPGEDQE